MILKANFPVDVNTLDATFDIQFGNVERHVHKNTSWDKAKFEVCGQKWVDMSEGDYGVSIITDSKYGYDMNYKKMGVSLIKSATDPYPEADLGEHVFTYGIYCHEGDWKEASCQFRSNQNAKTAKMSNLRMTALHVAASCGRSKFVQKLVKELAKEQLEATDQLGRTALHHATLAVDVDAAKAMMKKNPILPYLGDANNHTPLFYSTKWLKPSKKRKRMMENYELTNVFNFALEIMPACYF